MSDAPGPLTRSRQAHFVRVIEDNAAVYARNPMIGQSGTPRYLAEVADAHGWEWEWIGMYVQAHPEVFELPGLPNTGYNQVIADRRAKARVLGGQAYDLTQAGDFDGAAELVWQASVLAPDLMDWEYVWADLDAKRAQTPVTT